MRLLIQEPGKPAREFAAVAGLTIGRDPENSCSIDDDSASARHARLVLVDGRLAIEDLGSRNGTRIAGGAKLGRGETALLSPDLEIQLGNCRVRVVGVPAVADNPTLRPTAAPVEDLGATRPRSAPVQDNATMRPAAPSVQDNATMRPGAPAAPAENATMRSKPGAESMDAPTLVPKKAATPPPAPAAPPMPPVSKPASQPSMPIPATIPKPADVQGQAAKDDVEADFGKTISSHGAMNAPAIEARLIALAPRLAFVVHKNGRSVPIQLPSIRIGRRQVGQVTLALEDEGVSSQHADLSFDGTAFWIEDLGSKNGTWVGETKAAPKPNRLELKCDQRLRLGTVDVLFVRSPETGERPSPAEPYPKALARIAKDPNVPQEKLREAKTQLDQGRHPGEFLISANAITVAQWCDAVDAAKLENKISGSTTSTGTGGNKVIWILVGALVVAAAVITYLLRR